MMVLKTLIGVEKYKRIQTGMIIVEVTWLILGVVWLVEYYMAVQVGEAREIMLGM